jgi:hypothetical protein
MSCWKGGWYDAPDDNFDGAQYEYLIFDIKYDTNSTMPAADATWGIGLEQGWGSTELIQYQFNTNGEWQHVVVPISASTPGIGSTCGVGFYRWYPEGPHGSMGFWIANVQLIARTVPIAPPTVGLVGTIPGLNQFADKTPTYNRQVIRNPTDGSAMVDWVGQPKPVSYSWTIVDFPDPGHAGFFTSVNLSPDPAGTQTYADADWSATNNLFISMQAQADGSVRAGIAFKTNQPANNGQYYSPPTQLIPDNTSGALAAPSAIGTWTLTFTSDTDMTLTAPSGATTNASLPTDVAAQWTNISFHLISGMNSAANVGQSVTLSKIKITGVGTPIDEDLTDGVLDTALLVLQSQDYGSNPNPPNQFLLTSDARFWLRRTLPDTGFTPASSGVLPGGPFDWLNRGIGNGFINATERWSLVQTANLADTNQSYFAVIKRVPVKLQVLLPSEVAAPGTPAGKTGTVDSITAGSAIDVIVNSVDPAWYVGGGAVGDTIHVELNPPDPGASIPGDAALANGTVTFNIAFSTPGVYTVNATNVSNPSITAGISATITVTPP